MADIVHIENFGIKPTALEAINNNFRVLKELAESGGNDELAQKLTELETNVTSCVNKVTQLETLVTGMSTTLEETRQGMQTIAGTVTTLNGTVAQLQVDVNNLTTRVAALEAAASAPSSIV
jgi:outer membrane murein-binding lipoprotein Lpp